MTAPVSGRYRMIEELGRGAMGVVWKAHDDQLERDVAVKEVVLPGWLSDAERRQRHERTMREARSAARLTHPGIVTVHDVVVEDGRPWIVMELVQAPTLAGLVAESGGLPPSRAAAIGLQLLGALQAAHAAGVLHRDVKPGNVLVADARAVLTDFGIARMEGDPTLTSTGAMIGTPAFMAPELFTESGEASPASDLWSLGATLYFAVEGRRPYEQTDLPRLIAALTGDRPAPSARDAGPLAPVIDGLLRKDPARRLTAAEVLPLLEAAAVPASAPVPAVPLSSPPVAEPRDQVVETRADKTGVAAMEEAASTEEARRHGGETEPAAVANQADAAAPLEQGRSGMGRTLIAAVAPVVAALTIWGAWSAWPDGPPTSTPGGGTAVEGTSAGGTSAGGASSAPSKPPTTPAGQPAATPADGALRVSLTLPSGWREHSAGVFVGGGQDRERITVQRLSERSRESAENEAESIVRARNGHEALGWSPRGEALNPWRYTFCRPELKASASVQSVGWRPVRISRAACFNATWSKANAEVRFTKGAYYLVEMSWIADEQADEQALRGIAATLTVR